jgi:heme A synthase
MQNTSTAPLPGTQSLTTLGTVGAALALVILGASVLLRLTTEFDPSGAPISTLPSSIENVVRLTHRITAASVGLIAIALTLMCWLRKDNLSRAFKPTAGIVAATVLLAVIGPLTPGYRYASVTIANVVGGSILLMSCWWLREASAYCAAPVSGKNTPLVVAMLSFLTHIATGAATSALHMRGMDWVAYVHIGSAMLFLFTAGDVLWARSAQPASSKLAMQLTGILLIQIAMGVILMWLDRQPIWLAVVHALVSQVFAAGLVSLGMQSKIAR